MRVLVLSAAAALALNAFGDVHDTSAANGQKGKSPPASVSGTRVTAKKAEKKEACPLADLHKGAGVGGVAGGAVGAAVAGTAGALAGVGVGAVAGHETAKKVRRCVLP